MATLAASRLIFLIGSPPLHQAYELTNRRHAEQRGCQPGGREPRRFLVAGIPAAPQRQGPAAEKPSADSPGRLVLLIRWRRSPGGLRRGRQGATPRTTTPSSTTSGALFGSLVRPDKGWPTHWPTTQ
jgi:hypothetical protein